MTSKTSKTKKKKPAASLTVRAKKSSVKKASAATRKAPKALRPAKIERVSLVPSHEVIAYAASHIRDIPDFPKKGIVFKDITPLLASPRAFHIVLDTLAERFIGEHIDAVVGVDARGFIFGGALAARLNASFVPARKP
ncbi:MAG: hypothetical protein ABI461_12250, partial [Polyangiaceae bacterium]